MRISIDDDMRASINALFPKDGDLAKAFDLIYNTFQNISFDWWDFEKALSNYTEDQQQFLFSALAFWEDKDVKSADNLTAIVWAGGGSNSRLSDAYKPITNYILKALKAKPYPFARNF